MMRQSLKSSIRAMFQRQANRISNQGVSSPPKHEKRETTYNIRTKENRPKPIRAIKERFTPIGLDIGTSRLNRSNQRMLRSLKFPFQPDRLETFGESLISICLRRKTRQYSDESIYSKTSGQTDGAKLSAQPANTLDTYPMKEDERNLLRAFEPRASRPASRIAQDMPEQVLQ
jgi:hypothetical protein